MRRSTHRRTGSVYVFVLGCATLAAAAGMSAVILHGKRLERVQLAVQAQKVRADAQSALEFALAEVSQDPAGTTWRTSSSLAFTGKRYFGAGASDISIALTDPADSDLADSNLDPVTVNVAAVLGPCEQDYQMTLAPAQTPLSCLNYAVVVAGTLIKVNSGALYTSGAVSTSKSWEVDSDAKPNVVNSFNMVAQAGPAPGPVMVWRMPGSGSGGTQSVTVGGNGTLRSGVPYDPATMDAMIPNTTDAFKHYLSIGTVINYASLTGGEIRNVVLSPASNPYGTPNAQGVYVVNCAGSSVTLRDSRIKGTLVLLNCGSGTRIRDGVNIEPASDALPALLVNGSVSFDMLSTDLSESTTGINYNPTGSDYGGSADSDKTDTYPSWIRGLTYVSGDMTITSGNTTVRGVLVVKGNLTISTACELRVQYAKPASTVPAFARITGMSLSPGSLQRVVK